MPTVHWLGVGPGYPIAGEQSVHGVLAVAVGLGDAGAAWLARLARSAWFAGLELTEADLAAGDARSSAGTWDSANTGGSLPPRAPLITLAIDDPATADQAAVIDLAHTLSQRGTVMVTLPDGRERDFMRALQARGAFIVTGAPDASPDHVHHFPLRTAVTSRYGQLIGVDVADVLAVCRPGRVATLATYANLNEATVAIARNLASALVAHWHVEPREWSLLEFDRCLGIGYCPCLYTTTDRLDGVTGTVDLLMPDRT